jgi:uncharacterized protein (TIGR03118 family)
MKPHPWTRMLLLIGLGGTIAVPLASVPASAAQANAYVVHDLVSDGAHPADTIDPNLVNAWGLTAGPTSPWWVADNGTDLSTLYTAAGVKVPLEVQVGGGPTGAVFNGTPSFVVSSGTASGPALFLFASEDGTIRGWNPGVPPPAPSVQAQVAADRSSVGAIYKGLAIGSTPSSGPLLYATDFHNARVDVFDGSFNLVSTSGAFTDPGLPTGYAPFGIQSIGAQVFVTYAKQDADREDEIGGQSLGFVDVFDMSGAFQGRVATRGQLNAPWGLALAPGSFGRFAGDLLVGNFGDGEIHAFQLEDGTWAPRGALRGTDGLRIAIDGLWALEFGNGAPNNGPTDTLFFTAGPDDESHGLFGTIRAAG